MTYASVAINPFAKSSFGARIPDGKCSLSVGTRIQQRAEIPFEVATVNLFLYPGINCCVGVLNTAAPGTATYLSSSQHGTFSGTGTQYGQTIGETLINKWRTVSCGVNIAMVNNADGDEGWFEAIRLSPSNLADPELGVLADGKTYSVFNPTTTAIYPGAASDTQSMVNQPSYVSGKLRDIHKYLFALNPHAGDHDFQSLGTTGQSRDLYDNSHDCIMVRMYGTAGSTKVLVHSVHNQELFYDEESIMAKFHGPTYTSPATVARVNKMENSRVGAGTLVRGNATTPIRAMGAAAPKRRIVRRSPRKMKRKSYMPKRRVVRRRTTYRRIAKRPMMRRRTMRYASWRRF